MTRSDVKRLAEAVAAARDELGLTQKDFALRGGIGLASVQRVENGEVQPRTKTFTGLDRGAGWPPGTARAIFHSGIERPPSVPPALSGPHVESPEQRMRRLGALLRTRRRQMGLRSVTELADLTHSAVGTRTIEAVEAAERVISTGNYHALEIALRLPIGIMESVLRGDVTTFPDVDDLPGETDDERATYTKPEIRAIYRALGRDGFEEWVFRPTSHGGAVSATG